MSCDANGSMGGSVVTRVAGRTRFGRAIPLHRESRGGSSCRRHRLLRGAVLAGACLQLAVLPVRAELYRADLEVPGDLRVVRDTESGLDWLRLHETAGVNMTAILSGHGGWIGEGWRYATHAEVCQMLSHVFEDADAPSCTFSGEGASRFFGLFGRLEVNEYPSGSSYESSGFFVDDDPGDPLQGQLWVVIAYQFTTLIGQGAQTSENALHPSSPFLGPGVGNLLVRSSPAPVPALGTVGLLLVSACLLLAGAARALNPAQARR